MGGIWGVLLSITFGGTAWRRITTGLKSQILVVLFINLYLDLQEYLCMSYLALKIVFW